MNKSNLKAIVSAVAAIVFLLVLLLLFMHYIQKRSETRFTVLLASLKEGMPYSEAERILGKPQRTLTEQHDVAEWGTVKDGVITQECDLHMFIRMDVIPHRYILIYEDKKNHTVRLVAWEHT
jgi:hypothetical protein